MRGLLRFILVLIVIGIAAGFLLGWWRIGPLDDRAATGDPIDASKAAEVGAKVGERTAEAANKAGEVLGDAALSAKIKSKMALDDQVQSRSIDVSTTNHVVTLRGSVRSEAEHERAVRLARETNGVTQVIDHLTVPR